MERLQDELTRIKQQLLDTLPETRRSLFERSLAELDASQLLRLSIRAGDRAPDFTLADTDGQLLNLSACLRQGPVVLNFFRGGWCHFCQGELHAFQRVLPRLRQHGATVLAISPQSVPENLATRMQLGLDFPLLSDRASAVARDYGLAFDVPALMRELLLGAGLDLAARHDDSRWQLPVPASYVVGPDGLISYAYLDVDYTRRVDPLDALFAVKALS